MAKKKSVEGDLRQVCRLREECSNSCADSGKHAQTAMISDGCTDIGTIKGWSATSGSPGLQPKPLILWANIKLIQYLANGCVCVLRKRELSSVTSQPGWAGEA